MNAEKRRETVKTHMRRDNILAAETIPIRLIISIVVIAAIMTLVTVGIMKFMVLAAEHQVENECRSLEAKLFTMIASGIARDVGESNAAEGTTRVYTFMLPDRLAYLAFGVDPDPDNDGVLQTGLTEDGSVLCYQVHGGGKHVLWLPQKKFQFREGYYQDDTWVMNGEGQGFILNHGGTTTLVFELVQHQSNTYVLIHSTDTFEP